MTVITDFLHLRRHCRALSAYYDAAAWKRRVFLRALKKKRTDIPALLNARLRKQFQRQVENCDKYCAYITDGAPYTGVHSHAHHDYSYRCATENLFRTRTPDRERSRKRARPHIARAADQSYIYRPWLARCYAVWSGYRVLRGNPAAAVLGTDVSTRCGRN